MLKHRRRLPGVSANDNSVQCRSPLIHLDCPSPSPVQHHEEHRRRDRWSLEEVRVFLCALVNKGRHWSLFNVDLPGRSGMQCYRRWYNVQRSLWDKCIEQMGWSDKELCWLISAAAPFDFPLTQNQWKFISKSLLNSGGKTAIECQAAYLNLLASPDLKRQVADAMASVTPGDPLEELGATEGASLPKNTIEYQEQLLDDINSNDYSPHISSSSDYWSDCGSDDSNIQMKCGPWSLQEHQALLDAVAATDGQWDEQAISGGPFADCDLPACWFRIADSVASRAPLQCFLEWQLLRESYRCGYLTNSNCFSMPTENTLF